ncbi:MAG: glycosyltransferase family 39 protein [Acidobacterium ailaaui]|nr:glycosyltransferase family 39 protein [Pseudacidobacterium ailaaui]MCL6463206.1 glycosyltransferase family 39 protein [Pseudacidobacterium ailaaui]
MKRFLFPIAGLWLLLYGSFTLVRPPLFDGVDATHAEIAREILVSHDWTTFHLNGAPCNEVPPLLPWSIALSFRFFGVSTWAARVPLAFFALALFLAEFSLGRSLFGISKAGAYAAICLLTASGIFGFAHMLLPETPLCLWLTLSISFFWKSLQEDRPSLVSAGGFALCCALGVLTMGLPGVIFPVVIVLVFLGATKNMRHLWRWHPLAGTLIFLLAALPWHVLAARRNSAFLRDYFVHGHFLLYLGRNHPSSGHDSVPLWIFWLLLLLFLAPWCIFALKMLARLRSARQNALLLLAIWVAVVMLFFSFSFRQEYYLLPALPPLALLAGGWLAEDEAAPSRAAEITAWALFFVGVLAAIASAIFAATFPPLPVGTDVSAFLQQVSRSHRLFFGHFFDLTLRALGAFRVPFTITTAALLIGLTANLYFRRKKRAGLANCFLTGTVVAFLIAAHLAINTLSPAVSSQILANAIRPEMETSDQVIIHGPLESASSMAFYLRRPIRVLDTEGGDQTQQGMDLSALEQLWNGQQRIFLWTPIDQAPALPQPVFVLGRSGGKEVLSNQPSSHGAEF